MVELIYDVLALIGTAFLLSVVLVGLCYLFRELKKIYRVAKHYYAVCDHSAYFESDRDFFRKTQKTVDDLQTRVYRAEIETRNAIYRMNQHVIDKHPYPVPRKPRKKVKK